MVFCGRCGASVALEDVPAEATTAKLQEQARIAAGRARLEPVLAQLTAHVESERLARPTCFISYAWGVADHEKWVEEFVDDLGKPGLGVIFDGDDAPPGSSLSEFLDRAHDADRVIVVGTPEYQRKYVDGNVVAVEGKLINQRLRGGGNVVFPVLLAGDESSFPPQMQDAVRMDFTKPDRYFTTLLQLVLALYGIGRREPVSARLRSMLQA